ncbi:hypothetical protein L7F22_020589 [Adiantum nelumboides]|nr:hypothetical protein [Adiantum nelumboides]
MASLFLSPQLLCFVFFLFFFLPLLHSSPSLTHAQRLAPHFVSLLEAASPIRRLAAQPSATIPSTFDESALPLLAFKSSITNDPFLSLSSWSLPPNTSEPLSHPFAYCQWTGVGCDNLSHVISLSVPGMHLEGSISPALGSLPFLMLLNLSSNSLSGHIPPELGWLQSLLYLNLAHNRLDGIIPTELGNITSLTFLILGDNLLTGPIPSSLGNCTQIGYMDLSSNQLSGSIPFEVGNLTSLQLMALSQNALSGIVPPQILLLPNLTALDLSNNFLSGTISHLLPDDPNSCQSLQSLLLASNNITGSLSASIGHCKNLVSLQLQMNQINGTLPDELGALAALQTLDISSNRLHGPITKTFENATALVYLNLEANFALSGPLPAGLCRNPTLRYLYLDKNSLSGDLYALANCSSMIVLDVSFNGFKGQIPWEFGSFTDLDVIILGRNPLSGEIPPTLGNCSLLRGLALSGNYLTGAIPAELGNLQNLMELVLNNNSLSSSIPSALGNCSSLSGLHLDQNNLEGNIPEELGKLLFLEDCRLFMNSLTGPIPTSIFNCSKLIYLVLQENRLTGTLLPDVKALKSLKNLGLYQNLLTGRIPHEIGECSNLEFLSLQWNNFSGPIPDSIGSLVLMQELDLSNNLLSGPVPSTMANLENLTWLALAFNKLEGSINTLRIGTALLKLKLLFLKYNRLTGNIPEAIGNCQNLTRLHLQGNRLTGTIPPTFGKLKLLNELLLSRNQLTGSIPIALGDCLALRILNLAENKLNGSLPSSIGKLVDLTTAMNVSYNELTGDIPSELGALKVLVSLDLSKNNFSGKIPSTLESCVMLQIMNLSSNSLIGTIPDSLGSLLSLTSLNLSYNFLQGSIPASLSKLPNLTYFSVVHNNLVGAIPDSVTFRKLPNDSFLGNPGLCGEILQKPCPEVGGDTIIKWPSITGIAIAALVIAAVIAYGVRYKIVNQHSGNTGMIELKHFIKLSEDEVREGTDSFSSTNILGRGGFSTVYKATLQQRNGQVVAIKVLKTEQGQVNDSKIDRIFIAELNTLGKLRHRNLVRILGYCSNLDMKAIILEYVPNGSLEDWLYGASKGSLSWEQRIKIAIGISEGLVYLHHDYDQEKCIVHCDLKPSNILLDEELQPHIADFAIARILSGEGSATSEINSSMTAMLQGSIGYMAPEYGSLVKPSAKVDVYSYGVILLELVTQKKPTSTEFGEEGSLRTWVQGKVQDVHANLESIVDSDLFQSLKNGGDATCSSTVDAVWKQVEWLVWLGLKCTSDSATDRPSMKEALEWAKQHSTLSGEEIPPLDQLIEDRHEPSPYSTATGVDRRTSFREQS